MKRIFYSIIISASVLITLTQTCFAREIDLGLFTTEELNNLKADLNLKIKDKETSISSARIANWLKEKHSLNFEKNYKSEIENIYFCRYKNSLTCNLTFSYRKEINVKQNIFVSLEDDLLKKSLVNLSEEVNEEPTDSKLQIEDGRVELFSLSAKGMKLDEEKSVELISSYLKNRSVSTVLELPYQETDPQITLDSVDNIKIETLLGEGTSNFRGSPKNRIFNINVAVDRFNGILIKPGEEFSFVKILGEVDGEHGYLPELVIKKDKTEPEFGGGICQVSTTVFRAAIYSGLEITARRNHAYPVGYYNPQGMDSTVYVPKPDLRFKNDTPGHILVQAKIEGTKLTFQFYGISDGRKTTVDGPTVLEKNPDGSMKTVFTQKIYDAEDNLIREDIFKSNYESPDKFPHPGETSGLLTKKPKKWSDREWKVYKKEHGLN